MASPKNMVQRHAGLVSRAWAAGLALGLLTIALAVLTLGLTQGAALAKGQTATEVRIDDHGVKVNNKTLKSDEGIIQGSEGDSSGEGGAVRIHTSDKDVVRFGDDVIVDEGEVVQGDAVAILGSVVVNGVVEGDAVAIGGSVTVGPRGRVNGDGVGIGGGVDKDQGGVVKGQMVSLGKNGRWFTGEEARAGRFSRARHFPFGLFSRVGRFFFSIVWTLLLILLGLVVVAIARRPVENICLRAKKEAFKMGLIGLLVEVLLLPVIVLFCITIIGIPIGLVAIPLVFALAMLLGYTGIGLAIGERFANGGGKSHYWSVAMGILILQALAIVAAIVRLPGGIISIIGWVIAFIGWAVIYVAATVGLGAVIMTRFGTRAPKPDQAAGAMAAPVPPPVAPTGT